MAVRTALLTSRNVNLDTDFSKYIESVSTAGVITGFQVTASSVATGQAWVPCVRTNLETIYAFVQNYNSISISGNGYVIISIPQEIVDNGGGNEDGTGIATVEVVDTLPTKNYLLLATITGGAVTDNRVMIPKVGELKTDIDSINEQIADLDYRVDKLENAAAIDHLEERALVGEKYALTNTLFKQITPKLADSTVEANVGDTAANTEIHIQRQGSGTASNKLKIKIKKTGSPADLVVQVRKGIEVDVSSSEAYWYGDSENIIATGSVTASTITTSFQELEITLNAEFGGTEGELLDIVLKQNGSVNASNYYVIACDSTQWSEAFSYVSVNGSTRTRSKLMPYAVSDGFAQFLLAKVSNTTINGQYTYDFSWSGTITPSYSNYRQYFTITGFEKQPGVVTGIGNIVFYNPKNDAYLFGNAYLNGTAIPDPGTQEDGGYVYFSKQEHPLTNFNFSIPANTDIELYLDDTLRKYGSSSKYQMELKSISLKSNLITMQISKNISTHKCLPREIKDLGNKAIATLYGYHTDGKTWYTGN